MTVEQLIKKLQALPSRYASAPVIVRDRDSNPLDVFEVGPGVPFLDPPDNLILPPTVRLFTRDSGETED